MTDSDRLAAASRILAGLCANPSVVFRGGVNGWTMPEQYDVQSIALAVDLTADLITALEKEKPEKTPDTFANLREQIEEAMAKRYHGCRTSWVPLGGVGCTDRLVIETCGYMIPVDLDLDALSRMSGQVACKMAVSLAEGAALEKEKPE